MSIVIPAPLAMVFTGSSALSFLPSEIAAIRRLAHHEQSIAEGDGERERKVESIVASTVGGVHSYSDGLLPFLRKITGDRFPHETLARHAFYFAAAVRAFSETADEYPDLKVDKQFHDRALEAINRHALRDLKDRVHPADGWINLGANRHPTLDETVTLKDKEGADVEVRIELMEEGATMVFPENYWSRTLRYWRGPLATMYLNPPGAVTPEKPLRGPFFSPRVDVSLFLRVSFCAELGISILATPAFGQYRLTVRRPNSDQVAFDVEPILPPTVNPNDVSIQRMANERAAAFLYGILLFLKSGTGNSWEDTHGLMNEAIIPVRETDWVET